MPADTTIFVRRTRGLAAGVFVCALLAGCGGGSESPASDSDAGGAGAETTQQASDVVFRVYEVRGQITQLPTEADGKLMIRHEEIPDFDGGTGVRGMPVMNMQFWPPTPSADRAPDPDRVPESLDLSGFAVGDKVRARFEVQHAQEGAAPGAYYTLGLTALDVNTELDFGPEAGPAGEEQQADAGGEIEVIRFSTRALVRSLPDAERGMRFQAHHEEVPDFPNPDGSMGMSVMVMPFWPPLVFDSSAFDADRAGELDLTGIEVNDKVLITWELQRYSGGAILGYYAVHIEELDPTTALNLD